ncbi:hypothetical protein WUBG_03800 [Wuchereria bancrofti]|uniref:Uncharacterized protein n=1 Tax=Wuchereria bancrofti TaxID=6293 RepID=J9ESX4_WUCBA|nr:hypothetical protein WUBG_03800 [Wuchereria bancrofti]VDM09615.1 unnamed protein product [Wuchereria bancrofti]
MAQIETFLITCNSLNNRKLKPLSHIKKDAVIHKKTFSLHHRITMVTREQYAPMYLSVFLSSIDDYSVNTYPILMTHQIAMVTAFATGKQIMMVQCNRKLH